MRTFNQFLTICEAIYDRDQPSDVELKVGKIGKERKKTAPERRRTKAVGGGKTAPAKAYKARKDIGQQRQASTRVQQPQKERGSAALSPKEAQRKAYKERKAREKGGVGARTDLTGKSSSTSKEKEKVASNLLTQKSKPKTDPKYKAKKSSGYTAAERKAITRKGERVLRDIVLKSTGKKSEKELKHPISSSGYKYRKKDK